MAVTENTSAGATASRRANGHNGTLISSTACPPAWSRRITTLLTSARPGPGRERQCAGRRIAAIDQHADAALVTANLALVAAQERRPHLAVDSDTQARRGCGERFGLEPEPGLAQLLDGTRRRPARARAAHHAANARRRRRRYTRRAARSSGPSGDNVDPVAYQETPPTASSSRRRPCWPAAACSA